MRDLSKRILVLSLQPYDAGKTTLCKALIHGFRKAGVTFVPFKPHSGDRLLEPIRYVSKKPNDDHSIYGEFVN